MVHRTRKTLINKFRLQKIFRVSLWSQTLILLFIKTVLNIQCIINLILLLGTDLINIYILRNYMFSNDRIIKRVPRNVFYFQDHNVASAEWSLFFHCVSFILLLKHCFRYDPVLASERKLLRPH